MTGVDVFLDAFGRVNDSVHRILSDITETELHAEPHPSIGWLAWRLTRIEDSNVARLSGGEQLWLAGGWAERFGMAPEPADFGRGARHNREQVRAFRASAELLVQYRDVTQAQTTRYLTTMAPEELDRVLNEPEYTPLPTVYVRLVSVLENGMHNAGQMGFLKAYHRIGGWFPGETPTIGLYR